MDIVKNIQRTHEVLTPAGPVDPRRPRLARPGFPRMTCACCRRSSTRTSTPMAASRSISPGASTSRERPHERHDGYTHKDGSNEHSVPSFPLFISGGFRVNGQPMSRATQNEQCIRPHRLRQGLDRGPEPLGATSISSRPTSARPKSTDGISYLSCTDQLHYRLRHSLHCHRLSRLYRSGWSR